MEKGLQPEQRTGVQTDLILHFRCIPGEVYWEGVRDEMRRMKANPMIAAMFPTAEQMKAYNEEIGTKKGGHWCPECLAHSWHYADIAKKNPFYAQVWTPLHGDEDNYLIPMEYSGFEIANELKEKLGL